MDVKLFSLCKQEVAESEAGKQCILKCVKSFFPDCQDFTAFTSQKRMLLAVSQSLRAADIVVVAVQNNMYNATKRLLSAALDLKNKRDADVTAQLKTLLEQGKIKDNTYEANIRFPAGAVILPTDSGLNCGFALSAGAQHIIYLPIEAPRADEVVFGSLYDYFAELCSEEKAQKALDIRHSEIIKRTACKLDAEYVKVAFAGNEAVKMLEYYSPKNAKVSFAFDDRYTDASEMNLADECIKLREDNHSQLGVIVSSISEEDGKRFIKAVIAFENNITAITLYAEEDETDEMLIANCIDKVMLMLFDYKSLSDYVNEADITTKGDRLLRKELVTVTTGAIGITAVISLIIALIMK